MTVVYMPPKRQSHAGCLSRAPVGDSPTDDDDIDDGPVVGVLCATTISELPQEDQEQLQLIDFLEGKATSPPKFYYRSANILPSQRRCIYAAVAETRSNWCTVTMYIYFHTHKNFLPSQTCSFNCRGSQTCWLSCREGTQPDRSVRITKNTSQISLSSFSHQPHFSFVASFLV